MTAADLLQLLMIPPLLAAGVRCWHGSCLSHFPFPRLRHAFRLALCPGREGGFESMMTALAATVGTANVAGAAGAVLLGGPGALFWIWVCGLLGMAIKYCEAVLAVRFRRSGAAGGKTGGPGACMIALLGKRGTRLAKFYTVGGLFAAFSTGACWQSAAAAEMLRTTIPAADGLLLRALCGAVFAAAAAPVLLGGGKSAMRAANALVPAMCLLYAAGTTAVLLNHASALPDAIRQVFRGAFMPRAAAGGAVGGVFVLLRTAAAGVRFGLFSSEAGLGTAGISYASSGLNEPVLAGLCGVTEVFTDTMVLCTLTALCVLTAGQPETAKNGLEAVYCAFSSTFGRTAAGWLLSAALWLFALSSAFTWSWYGSRFVEDLGAPLPGLCLYRALFLLCCVLGAFVSTSSLHFPVSLSNALLLFPNTLLLRSSVHRVGELTQCWIDGKAKMGKER